MTRRQQRQRITGGALLLAALGALGALAASWRPGAFFAGWLVAWWWCLGVVLGALANLWLHTLTHGAWGEALRPQLLQLGRAMPVLVVLALPLAAGMQALYPWAASDAWTEHLSQPAFKRWWLTPAFVLGRGVVYLLLWTGLAWLSLRPRWQRSGGFAAVALMLYSLSVTLAAVDWLMSLMPRWYSAGFGFVVIAGQGLAGLAAGVLAGGAAAPAKARRDLGSLLFAYLLTWAYLAFVQFQIIWAGDLPNEIAWYLPRLGDWRWLALALVLPGFFLPLFLLLFRGVKQAPAALRAIAAGLLVLHALQVAWLVLPSLPQARDGHAALWIAPLVAAGITALCLAAAGNSRAEPRHGG